MVSPVLRFDRSVITDEVLYYVTYLIFDRLHPLILNCKYYFEVGNGLSWCKTFSSALDFCKHFILCWFTWKQCARLLPHCHLPERSVTELVENEMPVERELWRVLSVAPVNANQSILHSNMI